MPTVKRRDMTIQAIGLEIRFSLYFYIRLKGREWKVHQWNEKPPHHVGRLERPIFTLPKHISISFMDENGRAGQSSQAAGASGMVRVSMGLDDQRQVFRAHAMAGQRGDQTIKVFR